MRITLNQTVASPRCTGRAEQTVDCDDAYARVLIEAGAARPAGEDGATRPQAPAPAESTSTSAEPADDSGDDSADDEPDTNAGASPYTKEQLLEQTRADLLALASDLGVETTSTMTKPTIADAIIAATA